MIKMEILCLYGGIAFVYLNQIYPLVAILFCLFLRPHLRILIGFLLGISIACFHDWLNPEVNFNHSTALNRMNLVGTIAAIPSHQQNRLQLRMQVSSMQGLPVNFTALLNCYGNCPRMYVGDSWEIVANLKKPQYPGNPGEFDYRSFLRARHIDWIGTFQSKNCNLIKLRSSELNLLVLREKLGLLLERLFPEELILGIVQALTLEITTHISQDTWELFRRTGVIHLIGISGAHIALVVGLIFKIIHWCWSRSSRLCLYIPAPSISGSIAILVGFFYSLLAGLGVPVERAIISCSLLFFRYFSAQRLSPWQSWRYALALVLVLEPHAVFLTGFYLSFIAVAILLLINQRFKTAGIFKVVLIQIACMLGLMPLCIYWFSYGSINGLFANFFAIPLVELWLVPLSLLILCISYFVEIPILIWLVKKTILVLLAGLNWIEQFAFMNIEWSFNSIISVFILMGAMLILIFLPVKQLQILAILTSITTLIPYAPKVKNDAAIIDVLDVGQGLAILVRTTNHALIYDTGMKFFNGGDAGKRTIIPYLKTIKLQHLDKIIISHPDLDHRGGLASLANSFSNAELVVDNPNYYHQGESCHHYSSWSWDGIYFEFLPILEDFKKTNNHSCILKIATKSQSILLTGDIEALAENYLIDHYKDKLSADILLIPHHGSKTSSSYAFVNQVNPKIAIASYGLNNRYHFPHSEALQVYSEKNIAVYNTAEYGMLSVLLSDKDISLKHFRKIHVVASHEQLGEFLF